MIVLNKLSGVFHAALPCGEDIPARRRTFARGGYWRAPCGALLTQDDRSYIVGFVAPWDAEPCCKGPCARRLRGVTPRATASPE